MPVYWGSNDACLSTAHQARHLWERPGNRTDIPAPYLARKKGGLDEVLRQFINWTEVVVASLEMAWLSRSNSTHTITRHVNFSW